MHESVNMLEFRENYIKLDKSSMELTQLINVYFLMVIELHVCVVIFVSVV